MTDSIENSSNNEETLVDEDDLNQFTETLDQFTPAIPNTVTKHYMRQCGLQTDDDRMVKLLSVSVQKFMSDIINDCYQLHKLREKSTNRPMTTTTTTTTGNGQSSAAEVPAATTTDQSANAASVKKPIPSTNQTLTLHDLTHVLEEYGINVKKTFYYT